MAMFWKDAGWRCRTHRPMHHADLVGLIHLYQPIVGTSAISLYMTLVYQVPLHRAGVSKIYSHSYLLQLCSFTFDQLLEARHLLEGVGLINTYEIKNEDDIHYEYEMLPPLTPAKFFQSDILSITLYNSLGKERYFAVKDWLIGDTGFQTVQKEKKKNITRSFQEVFESISPAELAKQAEREKEMTGPVAKIDESLHQGKRPDFKQDIDFSMLEMRLSHLVEKEVWTDSLKQEIKELGFLYQLDEWAILKALQNPYVTSHGQIHLDRLRSFIRSEYCMQFGSTPVVAKKADASPVSVTKETSTPSDPAKPLSEEEKHIRQLAQISPLQLLAFYQKGARIPASDVEMVESLIRHYGLPPGVVNVLLEYVLLKYDYKLPRNLVEKIAGHWKRLGISSVEEAFEQAKKEEWEMKKKKQPRSSHTQKSRKKPEKLPHTLQMQMEQSRRENENKGTKEEWADQQEQIRARLRLMNEPFVSGTKEKENTP